MTDTPLPALLLAWITTMIATTLFVAALALSRLWDSAIYWRALQRALSMDT